MSRIADPTAKISLLRAAEEVFAESGLAAAKVEDIAKRAGHSKGAFYLHFESKEEAFKQVVESFLARCQSFCRPPAPLPDTQEAMVRIWLERDIEMFEFLWQNRAIVEIVAGCRGPYTYLFEAFREGVEGTCRDWIEVAKSRGLFRTEIDSEIVARLICGAYHELSHRMLRAKKKPDIARMLTQTLDVFISGIGTAAARRTSFHKSLHKGSVDVASDSDSPVNHSRAARARTTRLRSLP